MDIGGLIGLIATALTLAILGRSLLSWFPDMQRSSLARLLYNLTEPILAPFRQVVPMIGQFDISPIVAILVIQGLRIVLVSLL